MFVFILSHLLFWYRGGVVHDKFENAFSDKSTTTAASPAGRATGIFPISLLLMCSVTVTVLAKIAVFVPEKAEGGRGRKRRGRKYLPRSAGPAAPLNPQGNRTKRPPCGRSCASRRETNDDENAQKPGIQGQVQAVA